MAGLCAAARLRDLGVPFRLVERGDRPGGSMLLSSCVVWRHRSVEAFAEECPNGDPALQALVVERLDEALEWLESLGARATERATGNSLTVGLRFDPRELTDALVRRAGEIELGTPLPPEFDGPVVLATGGFGGELARRLGLPLRANPWSDGDGRRLAEARGSAFRGGDGEFYGRLLPDAPGSVAEADYVRAAQLYGKHGVLAARDGRMLASGASWSEVELPQLLARAAGRGWLVVEGPTLEAPVRGRRVADLVAVAEELGAEVRRGRTTAELGLAGLGAPEKLRQPPFTAVAVVACVTHTLGGLAVD